MSKQIKRVESLAIADLEAFPVWEYTNTNSDLGETAVRPIKRIPVENLNGRLVGTKVVIANGSPVWAIIGNVDANNPRLTQHFLTLSVFHGGQWFTMARYHDFDSHERGPKALSIFLDLPEDQVFPIVYDIAQYCVGAPTALAGTIEKEPREKMTRAEIIALAVN